MRCSKILATAAALIIASESVGAQGRGNPVFLMPPPGMSAAPEQLLTEYLSLRNDITRIQPFVHICGDWTRIITPDLRFYLIEDKKIASEIIISEQCHEGFDYHDWVKERTGNRDTVYITQFTLGLRHSQVYAFARPYQFASPVAARRKERFEWDHRQVANFGTSLAFSGFLPPH
jgi:hypothetical protein